MSDSRNALRLSGDDAADPVDDALVHGLLLALASRDRREAPPPLRRVGGRRLFPAVIAAAMFLAASMMVVLLGRPTQATAQTVMAMALEHSGRPGCRAYDIAIDPEGEGIGRRAIHGLVLLEGGAGGRMAARLQVGPLQRWIRFGVDAAGSWIDAPAGVRRGPDGAPLLSAFLGGLDDRVLRIDAVLARCSEGHDVLLVPSAGDGWMLRAVRRPGGTDSIVEAEFLIRRDDGAVVEARIDVESAGGYRAEVGLSLNENVVAAEQDLAP